MKVLDTKNSYLRFYALATVEEAIVKDDLIEGRWARIQPQIPFTHKLLEDFANWGTDLNEIRRFTKLKGHLLATFDENEPVRFHVDEWRSFHAKLRENWNRLCSRTGRFRFWPSETLPAERDEFFTCVLGDISYKVNGLYRLMLIGMFAMPHDFLRKCLMKDCPNPYFVADDLKRKYCSEECARKAANVSKLRYWNTKEKARRAMRSKMRSKPSSKA